MTNLDVFITVLFAVLGAISFLIYRFMPTYIKVKPTPIERYKRWRLKKYFEKHGGEQNARNYR